MGTKTTEAPAATYSEGTMVLGGTHGASAVTVQCVEVASYVFYREVDGTRWYEHCGRCDGSGHMHGFEYIANGVCFECGGMGRKLVLNATEAAVREIVRKRILAKAARVRAAERKRTAAEQAAADWATANADLAAALAGIRDRMDAAREAVEGQEDEDGYPMQPEHGVHHILADLARKATRYPLSEKQAAFATSLLGEQAEVDERARARAEAKAAQVAASHHLGTVDEKLTVTGVVKVATIVRVPSFRIPGDEDSKPMIVLDVDGSEVKVFSQAQWAWDAEKGQALTLTGTVKRHSEYQGVAQTELGGRIKVG